MDTDFCVIRNYRPADLEGYIRLHAEAESICASEDTFLLSALKGESPIPDDFSEQNLFLAEERGRIVGACRVVPEPAIDRAVLRLLLRAGLLDSEAAAGLLGRALERAADLGIGTVHADVREKDEAAREFFAGLGFRPVRRYAEMELSLDPAPIVQPEREGLSVNPLQPNAEEEAEFTRLQNHVFSGSWGFCPNSPSEITQRLNTPGYGHEGVMIAYQDGKPAGYCWTAEVRRSGEKVSETIGRIHMMGVAPEFHGRGLGTPILLSGLKHLALKGISTIELTADCENEAACALYGRVGFKETAALVWYEKKVG
jgi:mycothiol synthase